MENSSKTLRDTLALQMREKLKERNHQLEQAEMSIFSDKLKEMMRLEIMRNFKKEIDKIMKTQWYDRARQAHLEVNRAKRNLNRAILEKENLLQEYKEKLAKADENIVESQKMYEEAEMKYKWEIQDSNIDTWKVIDNNINIKNNLHNEGSSEDIDDVEEIQESSSDTNELVQQNSNSIDNINKDEIWDSEVKIDKSEDIQENSSDTDKLVQQNSNNIDNTNGDKTLDSEVNNPNLNGAPSENDGDFFEIKNELFWNEEAIKEDLKKNHVTIEECMDKTWYFGKNITIDIPKVWDKFPWYKFECFVSDEKFKSIDWLSNIRGRFIYRDDIYRLLDAINSYMNVYWITKDKFGYNRDMLWEIDNCVGMDCFKYITWLDSLYWLGCDITGYTEYKFNCTGKKQIFIDKNKRSHLLLKPSK